jgi:hypothetical protein
MEVKEETIWESPVKGKGLGGDLMITKKGFVRIKLGYFEKGNFVYLFESEIECENVEICYPDKEESVIHFWTDALLTSFSPIIMSYVEKIYMLGDTLVIECSDKEISKAELKQAGMI